MTEPGCPHCGRTHEAGARFCALTGAPLPTTTSITTAANAGPAGARVGEPFDVTLAQPQSGAANEAITVVAPAVPIPPALDRTIADGVPRPPALDRTIADGVPLGVMEAGLAGTLPQAIPASASASAPGPAPAPVPASIPAWAILPDDGADAEDQSPHASPPRVPSALADFGRRLQVAAQLYLDNLLPLLPLAALLLGPPSLITSPLTASFSPADPAVPSAALMLISVVVTTLVMGAAWPLCTAAVAIVVLAQDGRTAGEPPVGIGTVLQIIARNGRGLVMALVPVAFLIGLGYVLFVIPGLLAQLFLTLVPTVVLLEGHQGGAALRRSATLMRDALAPAVGVLVVFGLAALLLRRVVTAIVPGNGDWPDLLAADLAFILIAPIPMIALVLIYRDLRRSQDGVSDADLGRAWRAVSAPTP